MRYRFKTRVLNIKNSSNILTHATELQASATSLLVLHPCSLPGIHIICANQPEYSAAKTVVSKTM